MCEKHRDVDEISKVLKKYNLLVNNDKTEYTTISRKKSKKEEKWRDVKKVGSLLGDKDRGVVAGGGAGGPWPTLEFRSSDFSEILRFRRKITDFGLALSTFDQFRFFHRFQFFPQHLLFSLLLRRHFPDIGFVLGSVYTLCTRASKKLRRSCTIKGHCFGRHC